MAKNIPITIFHKVYNKTTRLEEWIRYNYEFAWLFGGKGASINKGYDNANDVDARIWYETNENLDINNFKIGDIIVKGTLNFDIDKQQDLKDYDIYNITSINNNDFGTNPHIHIGGK